MNILYGVPGEGMGHATRSKVIIDFLLQEDHNVQVVSSSRAYQFLNKNFPKRVHEIEGMHFAFKESKVSKTGTVLLNVKNASKLLFQNFAEYLELKNNFKPDLVISDFETFTTLFAKKHDLPLISIDNMQVINRCKLDIPIPSSEKNNYTISKSIVKVKVPNAQHYFISSFFEAQILKENTTLVPPIVREAISNALPKEGNHILMYQSSSTIAKVTEALHQIPEYTFYVYGFNKDLVNKNIIFKTFSEEGFVHDLATAKAVIANGGFSFISEAVYLKKPVYSFPLQDQFEQFVNASYIQKLGYGRHFEELTADNLKAFLFDIPKFSKNLAIYSQKGNAVLFEKLKAYLQAFI
ncbi:MJ1255/VC2487 family glycosyltransferase [Flavobacterium oreochromis]|uniref:MJ1255/VC2487 family glycosyltransferase n=1 Tax=Flavobacterium oreochromis TaxID=2906078 RepID=UPI00385DE353